MTGTGHWCQSQDQEGMPGHLLPPWQHLWGGVSAAILQVPPSQHQCCSQEPAPSSSPSLGQDSTEQPPTEPTRVGRSCRTEQGCCLQHSSNTHYIQHLSQNWAAELPASVTATQSRPGACPFPADPRRARVMGAGPARTTLLPKQPQPGGISRAASPALRSKQQGCPTRAPALSITAAN